MTTVMVLVPKALVATLKVRTPLVAIAGAVAKAKLVVEVRV